MDSYRICKEQRTSKHKNQNQNKYPRTTSTKFSQVVNFKSPQKLINSNEQIDDYVDHVDYGDLPDLELVAHNLINSNEWIDDHMDITNLNEVYVRGNDEQIDDYADLPDLVPVPHNANLTNMNHLLNLLNIGGNCGVPIKINSGEILMIVEHKKDKYRPILLRDNGLSFRYCKFCTNLRKNGKSSSCEHGGTGTLTINELGKRYTFKVQVNSFFVWREEHRCHRLECAGDSGYHSDGCEHDTFTMQTRYYFTPLEEIPSSMLMPKHEFNKWMNNVEKFKYAVSLNELNSDLIDVICNYFCRIIA